MGIRDWFKKKPKKAAKRDAVDDFVDSVRANAKAPAKSEKEIATEKGEPWVSIVKMDIDPNNLHQGAFELDWNEYFVAKFVKAGYAGKDDQQIVERWFQDICRNVVMENFEQWEANQPEEMRPRVIDRKDLGGGRTEVS